MGHVGLTPQAISVLGGFRAQGRTAAKALQIIDDALALQEAGGELYMCTILNSYLNSALCLSFICKGAFAIVIECVPAVVAEGHLCKIAYSLP